jgi:hypothetical protein
MKVNKVTEQEKAFQVRHLAAIKQYQQENHKHHLKALETASMEETRIQRNKRLSLPKGRNVDIDC